MDITIPRTSLVVLCGIAGCGKSTFASCNFKPTEVVSSDRCRAIICDDESNMEVSKDAFELFHFIISKRMKAGRLVVADSTAISYEARKVLVKIAKNNNYHVMLIVFDVPLEKAMKRNSTRDRQVPCQVIEKQYYGLKKSIDNINKENFDQVLILDDEQIKDVNCIVAASGIEDNKDDEIPPMNKINTGEFAKSIEFVSKDGQEVKLSIEEVQESLKLLDAYNEKLPWIVYAPPLIPCAGNGDLLTKIRYSLKYYADRGMHKCIVEPVKQESAYIVVLSRNRECSGRYFSSDEPGCIYSLNNECKMSEQTERNIIGLLHAEFIKSRYFEQYKTDYIIFEAYIFTSGTGHNVIPVKIVANSRMSLLDKDNIWQAQNTGDLSDMSQIMSRNGSLILDSKNYRMLEIGRFIHNGSLNNVAVKPVKTGLKYKGRLLPPAIMCSLDSRFCGDEYIKLSTAAYELGRTGVEMFIRNKFSKKYFEFLTGCVTINNRMLNMRM